MDTIYNSSISSLESVSLDSPVPKSLGPAKLFVHSYLPTLISSLHFYFDVTHSYILSKISLILLPFLHTDDWNQTLTEQGQPLAPSRNVQSFDLYIPVMAYITFLLLAGIQAGRIGYFSPEYLGVIGSAGIGCEILDVLMIYAGLYFLDSELPYFIDILAFAGYKFLPCSINKAIAILLGSKLYNVCLAYTAITLGIFTVCNI